MALGPYRELISKELGEARRGPDTSKTIIAYVSAAGGLRVECTLSSPDALGDECISKHDHVQIKADMKTLNPLTQGRSLDQEGLECRVIDMVITAMGRLSTNVNEACHGREYHQMQDSLQHASFAELIKRASMEWLANVLSGGMPVKSFPPSNIKYGVVGEDPLGLYAEFSLLELLIGDASWRNLHSAMIWARLMKDRSLRKHRMQSSVGQLVTDDDNGAEDFPFNLGSMTDEEFELGLSLFKLFQQIRIIQRRLG